MEYARMEILRRVVHLDLLPGCEVAEADLARMLDCDDHHVRAALKRLTEDGIVEPVRGSVYRIVPVVVQVARDVFQLWSLLQAEAAALAARGNIGIETLRALEAAARDVAEGGGASASTPLLVHARFHTAVAQGAGNARLAVLIEELLDEMEPFLRLALRDAAHVEEVLATRGRLLEAVKRGDATAARAEARAQVAAAQRLVFDALVSAHDEVVGEIVEYPRSLDDS